jgi:hypothetical protein
MASAAAPRVYAHVPTNKFPPSGDEFKIMKDVVPKYCGRGAACDYSTGHSGGADATKFIKIFDEVR